MVVIDVQSGKVVPRIDMELHETARSCISLNGDVRIIREENKEFYGFLTVYLICLKNKISIIFEEHFSKI